MLSDDPATCAEYHVDRHVVKMILEYSQLLSTAHRVLDGLQSIGTSKSGRSVKIYDLTGTRDVLLYRATHINHPSAIWVRQSEQNYIWLWRLLNHLCAEYTYRYGRVHKCQSDELVECLVAPPHYISSDPKTSLLLAMPDEYHDPDPIVAYRKYYTHGKKHLHQWRGRSVPDFITDMSVSA